MVVNTESAWTAPAAASARPASRIRKPRRRRPRWVLGWRCMSKLLFVPADAERGVLPGKRSEEHTSELQSLMRISYAVFCLKKKKTTKNNCIVYHTKKEYMQTTCID